MKNGRRRVKSLMSLLALAAVAGVWTAMPAAG
ncbi:MAG: hypothetical protein QOF04_685, partial [Solirubrobacteraceae bacterium]|nr:hypothetical protein [Solirubrobacteraceae bacterium]